MASPLPYRWCNRSDIGMAVSMRSAGVRALAAFALATVGIIASTSRTAQAVRPDAKAGKRGAKLDLALQRVNKHRDDLVRVIVKPAPGHHDAVVNKERAHG